MFDSIMEDPALREQMENTSFIEYNKTAASLSKLVLQFMDA
jgi:hypothetical protein